MLGATAGTAGAATPSPSTGFVTRQGSQLMLNGKPFKYTGANYYYGTNRNNMPSGISSGFNDGQMDQDLADLDTALKGRDKVLRIWFFQRQATVAGKRDWAAFDHTLKVAAAHGYKVIAVLTDQYGTIDGPYKSLPFYTKGYRSDIWPTSTTTYYSYVQQVVARYKDDPTIMAWQLVNEGKADSNASGSCPSEDAAFSALYSFTKTMTTLIHSIDPRHLISDGLLYNNCGIHAGTTHYAQIANLPYNDLYEYHDYSGPTVTASRDFTDLVTQATAAKRPLIVGEVGVDRSIGLTARANAMAAKYKVWASYPAVAGVTPWVWNPLTRLGSIDRYFDIGPGDPVLAVMASFSTAASSAK